MTTSGAETYFLLLQTAASGILALAGVLAGLFFAWIIWGRRGRKLESARTDVAQLREEWEKLRPAIKDGAGDVPP